MTLKIEQAIALAGQHHMAGRLPEAESIYRQILQTNPDQPVALHLLGLIAHQVGQNDVAVDLMTKALAIKPDYALAYNNLGLTYKAMGRLDEAVTSYHEALAIKSDFAEAHNNLGIVLTDLGRPEEAVASYHKAFAIKPDYAEAHNNLGIALMDQGRLEEAVESYHKALAIKPDYARAQFNLGIVLTDLGRPEEAVASYHKALAIKPDYAEAYNNLGNIFKNLGKVADAIAAYREALRLKPDYEATAVALLHQLRHVCAWPDVDELEHVVEEFTSQSLHEGGNVAFLAFDSVTSNDNASENFVVARANSDAIAEKMSGLKTDFKISARKADKHKITIGYLSNDFRNHAVAHLMLSLFELHDRNDFNVFAFSHGRNDESSYREKIKNDSDKFFDIQATGHLEAARQIYESGVDILVDLNGHTENNWLEICALRPAPVQASYLGFPGTTGADFLDYFITDRIVTPEDQAPYYSEKFVYLPHSYQINDHQQKVSDIQFTRSDLGLPEKGFVFSSFNRSYKIEPVMFDVWMNLLKRVPHSVLWLLGSHDLAEQNLTKEAQARGVNGERLIFTKWMPKDQHLARYRLADLALDTRICCGHTTTCDALWGGVPVVTMLGAHFASRVSASLLTAVGLPELITRNLEEYEALAFGLSQNQDELNDLKIKLAHNRQSEPLFDTPRFVGNLESAYRTMWSQFVSGKSPAQIDGIEG